jgi:hypothetical protein
VTTYSNIALKFLILGFYHTPAIKVFNVVKQEENWDDIEGMKISRKNPQRIYSEDSFGVTA